VLPLILLLMPLATQTVPQLEASARARLAAHDAKGALEAYEALAKAVPKSAEYQDEIGFLLAATGRDEQALPYFERATVLDPRMALAWYHRGVALRLMEKRDEAVSALQMAVTLAPDRGDYRFRLGTAWSDSGNYAKGAVELAKAAKSLPGSVGVWEALGLAYQKLNRFAEARDAYRHAVELNPKDNSLRNSYGAVLVKAGDPVGGLREFQRVLAEEPDNTHVQVNVGYAYIAEGKFREAIQELSALIKKHPEDGSAHYDLGVAYKGIDDLPHAAAELEKAVELEPSLAEAHYTLATTLVDQGQAEKAIAQLRAAVAQRPEYVDAWFQLGSILKQQGDVDGAIEALRRSVALDDKDAGAFNTLGLLLRRKGDVAGAKDAFARAEALRQAELDAKQKRIRDGAAKVRPSAQ